MKIMLGCITCAQNNELDLLVTVPLQENPIYEYTCINGHKIINRLQEERFQLLFESGIKAYKDGYYRESITSFYVALERFYEFIIGAGLLEHQVVSTYDEVKKFLKTVKRSENLIGAYNLTLMQEIGDVILFNEKFADERKITDFKNPVNFRNEIIHNGYIPTQQQALHFGYAVSDYIFTIMKLLVEKSERILLNAVFSKIKFIEKDLGTEIVIMGVRTFLQLYNSHLTEQGLEEYISGIKS